jgi:hypothetical protein
MLMIDRLVQDWKALLLIEVTEVGMDTDINIVQFLKASAAMTSTSVLISMFPMQQSPPWESLFTQSVVSPVVRWTRKHSRMAQTARLFTIDRCCPL